MRGANKFKESTEVQQENAVKGTVSFIRREIKSIRFALHLMTNSCQCPKGKAGKCDEPCAAVKRARPEVARQYLRLIKKELLLGSLAPKSVE